MSDTLNNRKSIATGRKVKRAYVDKAVADHLLALNKACTSASALVKTAKISVSEPLTATSLATGNQNGVQSGMVMRVGRVKKLRQV